MNGLVVKDVKAVVMNLPMHSSGNSQNISGLLGLSFMEHFKVTVDRANSKIMLEKN